MDANTYQDEDFRNTFLGLPLCHYKRASFQHHPIEESAVTQQGRKRRRSEHLIKEEVIELQKRIGTHSHKRQTFEDLQSSKLTYKSLKEITFEKVLKKDLQTHYKSLEGEGEAISPQQEEQLGYVTFKMVKQKEKHYYSDLRNKINSGTLDSEACKGRMSLPASFKSKLEPKGG